MSFIHLLLCLSFYWVRCFVVPCIEYPSSECNMRTNMGSDLVPTPRASFLFVPPIHSNSQNEFEDELPVSATVGAILFGSLLISFESQPKIWHHNFGVGRIACCHTVRVLYIYRLVYSRYIYIYVYGVATSWSRQAEQLEISNLLCRLCRAYLLYRDSSGRSGLIPVLHRSEFLFWTLCIFNY